jgi:hypothetical protein
VANPTKDLAPILNQDISRFLEAVVHPFGATAIGAIIPDKYQELVVPTTDRIELDVSPSDFYLFNPPESESGFTLVGIFMWFQPRCISSGILGANVTTSASTAYQQYPFAALESDFATTASSDIILNQYVLCMTGIWNGPIDITLPTGKGYGFYDSEQLHITNTFVVIQYARFQNIDANCVKLRICGAGLKAWSEEAPINTGGYSVGGWATIDDILSNFLWHITDATGDDGDEQKTNGKQTPYTAQMRKQINEKYVPYGVQIAARDGKMDDTQYLPQPKNPGAIHTFQQSIKFPCRSPGVKGSTVRYSSLQTMSQMESQYPQIPASQVIMATHRDGKAFDPAATLPTAVSGDDFSAHDVITSGSYVPCIFWNFNTTSDGNVEQYTIKVMSMVHSEGVPTGTSPFMSTKSNKDPAMNYVKDMVENVDAFPVASVGHSFKSFFAKTRHIISKIGKTAGHISRIIQFADKFAESFG